MCFRIVLLIPHAFTLKVFQHQCLHAELQIYVKAPPHELLDGLVNPLADFFLVSVHNHLEPRINLGHSLRFGHFVDLVALHNVLHDQR